MGWSRAFVYLSQWRDKRKGGKELYARKVDSLGAWRAIGANDRLRREYEMFALWHTLFRVESFIQWEMEGLGTGFRESEGRMVSAD